MRQVSAAPRHGGRYCSKGVRHCIAEASVVRFLAKFSALDAGEPLTRKNAIIGIRPLLRIVFAAALIPTAKPAGIVLVRSAKSGRWSDGYGKADTFPPPEIRC